MATSFTPKSIADIEAAYKAGELRRSHSATRQGYVSRKTAGQVLEYRGRYGNGFVIDTPRFDSTRYILRTYYVQPKQA